MAVEQEKQSIEQIKKLEQFIPSEKQEELAKILAFGEKYKADSNERERKFWSKYGLEEYKQLISQYERSKEKFIKWLTPQERKILDSISESMKDKFYREYLFDWIVYSWDVTKKDCWESDNLCLSHELTLDRAESLAKERKSKFKPWIVVDLHENTIPLECLEVIAREWKDSLQPWMTISLPFAWYDWIEILIKEWKYKLQPWINIVMRSGNIWYEWVALLARERKDNLQPWMTIDLEDNCVGDDWIEILVKEWKDKLQPWMVIDLSDNYIWDEGADYIMNNLELKPWMVIDLRDNDNITEEKQKDLEKWIKDKWINCKIELWCEVL